MFEAMRLLFIYVEMPLHAGAGRALGTVDLPVQRERTTNYPMIQASSIKGKLRAEAYNKANTVLSKEVLLAIFGPETEKASEHAGSLSVGDARILLFPVRSLSGVFAWTTSVDVLSRFAREAAIAGLKLNWSAPPPPDDEKAWVNGETLLAGDSVVLEEYSFVPKKDYAETICKIGEWLAANALPPTEEYRYWRDILPNKLCVLPEVVFRDFALYATEVQTHIRLNPDTKTAEGKGLWTTESIPVDTLFYAPLMATRSRRPNVELTGEDSLEKMVELDINRTQLGGDETTGHGLVSLRIVGGGGR